MRLRAATPAPERSRRLKPPSPKTARHGGQRARSQRRRRRADRRPRRNGRRSTESRRWRRSSLTARRPGAGRISPTRPRWPARSRSKRAGLTIGDIDLVEINEAFASVALICVAPAGRRSETSMSTAARSRSVIRSARAARGSCLSLALELRRRGGGLGLAAICSGGGQGDAIVIQV